MDTCKAQSLKAILQQLIGDNFSRRTTEKTVILSTKKFKFVYF